MHLCGGILTAGAVVLPPDELDDLHAAVGTGRRGVIPEERDQRFPELFGVLLAEAGLVCGLHVDRAERRVYAVIDAVLHAHGVGRLFVRVCASLEIDRFGDLRADDVDALLRERALDRHRAADADGHSVAAALIVVLLAGFEGEHLAEGAHVQPRLAGDAAVILAGDGRRVALSLRLLLRVDRGQTFLQSRAVVRAVLQGAVAVARRAAVVGLHEHGIARVDPAVADLALEAHVRDLAETLIGRAGTVAIERVAVGVGVADGENESEVDFVLQSGHGLIILSIVDRVKN